MILILYRLMSKEPLDVSDGYDSDWNWASGIDVGGAFASESDRNVAIGFG